MTISWQDSYGDEPVHTKWKCGSCAGADICGLGQHKNAEDAMFAFCSSQLGSPDKGDLLKTVRKKYEKLYSFYTWIAGPEVPKGAKGSSHHCKDWVRYGTEFAEFIEANGLGKVATLGQKLNAKFHPTTTCQVWLWSPDQKACETWWTENYDRLKKAGCKVVDLYGDDDDPNEDDL